MPPGNGDAFSCKQDVSSGVLKSEALNNLDELNSFLGVVKTKSGSAEFTDLVKSFQQNLFIIQSEIAGGEKSVLRDKIDELKVAVENIKKEVPSISSFVVSGGTELSALFDYARTLARRAERRVLTAQAAGEIKLGLTSLTYLNCLSGALYALARLANVRAGIKEETPGY